MAMILKRRFSKKKKREPQCEKEEASALMPCQSQHLEDESSISHSIMVMCSPFHYKSKQYRQLRLILIEYIEYIKRLLALVHPVSSTITENDQLLHLCSMMRDQLDRIKHAFRKVSACRHDIDFFYYDQCHLLDQANWLKMEQTLVLLCTTLPVENDYLCPICLCILNRPTVLHGCHHRFCEQCIEDYFLFGGDSISKHHRHSMDHHQATPSAITTTPTTPTTTTTTTTATTTTTTCPVCRAPVTQDQVQHDQALSNFLALYFPPIKPWWSPFSSMMKSIYMAWCATSCSYCCSAAVTMFPLDDTYVQGQIYMSAWY